MKKIIIPIICTIVFGFLYYYIVLPPINIHSINFWSYIITILTVFLISSTITGIGNVLNNVTTKKNGYINYNDLNLSRNFGIVSKILLFTIAGIIISIIGFNFLVSPFFNADSYANRININETNTFASDINEVDFTKIPLLDKDSTQKLGDRKMGEMPEWVSQFYVSELYTQINYNEEILRVTPLEYDGIFKYFSNKDEGIQGYITVNSVDGKSNLVKIDEGMKYMPSAFFSEDLYRKLRFDYPTVIFGEETFEIDEEGNPYWIVPTVKYTGINVKKEITGAIVLDAITGESTKYDLEDVPSWVDHVFESDLIIEQVDNWGTYVNGFWNSIFGQKNVVNTTDGYNYLTIDDDVYLYTGITSVAADESNLGFILVNLRTKEANYYPVAGAEEYSAMSSAEGLVQEKGYVASFPLLINLNGRPTYLMSLKDAAGLVKMYAFVDVVDYQIVSTTESSLGIEKAAAEYLSKINSDDSIELESLEKEIIIKSITSAIIDGDTNYFITDEDNLRYQVSIKVKEDILPFLKNDDEINITYIEGDINIIKTIE